MLEEDNDVHEEKELESARAEEDPISKDDEVAKLKAELAELKKQQGSSKGVLRRPPPFEGVPGQLTGSAVKTKRVADVPQGGSDDSVPTTKNKVKATKVRTRADGPSETLELMGSGSKKSKKKKVGPALDDTNDEDDDHMTLDGVSQIPPTKVKATLKK